MLEADHVGCSIASLHEGAMKALVYGRRAAELRIAASGVSDAIGKKALLRAAERYEKLAGQKALPMAPEFTPAPKRALPLQVLAPYRLQMWDQSGSRVEKILAESPDSRAAYDAYFEAARAFPMRHLTLIQNERVLARWHPPGTGR